MLFPFKTLSFKYTDFILTIKSCKNFKKISRFLEGPKKPTHLCRFVLNIDHCMILYSFLNRQTLTYTNVYVSRERVMFKECFSILLNDEKNFV